MSDGGMSPEMVKAASDMISSMSPEEIQRMLEMASSLDGKGFPASTTGTDGRKSTATLQTMGMSPDMIKTASDMMRKMSPDELKKMFDMAATMNGKDLPFSVPSDFNSQKSQPGSLSGTRVSGTSRVPSTAENFDAGDSSHPGLFQDSMTGPSNMNLSTSTTNLQEQMRNQMKDPAMRQVSQILAMLHIPVELFFLFLFPFGVRVLGVGGCHVQGMIIQFACKLHIWAWHSGDLKSLL